MQITIIIQVRILTPSTYATCGVQKWSRLQTFIFKFFPDLNAVAKIEHKGFIIICPSNIFVINPRFIEISLLLN